MTLEITNYTKDTAYIFDNSADLETFYNDIGDDEVEITHSDIGYIPSDRDEALELLNLSDEEQNKIEAMGSLHGENYYNSIEEHLEAFENLVVLATVEGATTPHQTAHELNYTIGLEEELNRLLGCSAEAYEQLGQFVTDDDIERILDTEYNLIHLDNSTLVIIPT